MTSLIFVLTAEIANRFKLTSDSIEIVIYISAFQTASWKLQSYSAFMLKYVVEIATY